MTGAALCPAAATAVLRDRTTMLTLSFRGRRSLLPRGNCTPFRGTGMRKVSLVATVVLALGLAGAQAQTYPSKPINLIVPFPAGGPTDTIARIISDHMKDTLGQAILVETVTGAGATIGVGRVVGASPDGYTLSIGNWSSHVGSPAIYPVSWNPVNDLEPIARLPVSSLM